MEIADLIRSFCEENSEQYSIYEGYSGRFMFGKKCLGIVVKKDCSYMEMFVKLTQYLDDKGFDDDSLELEGVSIDELGLSIIAYFPKIKS